MQKTYELKSADKRLVYVFSICGDRAAVVARSSKTWIPASCDLCGPEGLRVAVSEARSVWADLKSKGCEEIPSHEIPKPLPANSRLLDRGRFVADAHGKKDGDGRRRPIASGRFKSLADAVRWADSVVRDASLVIVVCKRESNGWESVEYARRTDSQWSEPWAKGT